MESGSSPACIWKENCSDQFISVDSKGSVTQCDCWVTSYPKYFFGNILREPGLTRISRQALRDATLSSDFLNGKRFSMCWLLVPFQSARSTERAKIWRLRMDLTRDGSTKKMTGTIRFGDWWHRL